MITEKLKKRNKDNLELMKKYLPNTDWKLQRIENKVMSWDLDNMEEKENITLFYETKPTDIDTIGEIHIDVCEEEYTISDIEVDFIHSGEYGDKNTKTIGFDKQVSSGGFYHYEKKTEKEIWEEINEFFTTYLIPKKERIKKELPTELSNKVHYLLRRTHHYQYDDILLTELFGSKNSKYPSEERKYLEEMRKDFEKVYKEERLKRGLEIYPQGYFGTTIGMIQSFLNHHTFGEFEYWYEKQLEEMKRDLETRENE